MHKLINKGTLRTNTLDIRNQISESKHCLMNLWLCHDLMFGWTDQCEHRTESVDWINAHQHLMSSRYDQQTYSETPADLQRQMIHEQILQRRRGENWTSDWFMNTEPTQLNHSQWINSTHFTCLSSSALLHWLSLYID